MYFSGCLHKSNTKVAFILIFKVAALAAYDFSTLSANQQRERGPVSKAGRRQQVCAVLPALRELALRPALRVPARAGAPRGVLTGRLCGGFNGLWDLLVGACNIVLSAGIHGFKKLPRQLKMAFLPFVSRIGICRECLHLQYYFPLLYLYILHTGNVRAIPSTVVVCSCLVSRCVRLPLPGKFRQKPGALLQMAPC